jgi:hypothetical protein
VNNRSLPGYASRPRQAAAGNSQQAAAASKEVVMNRIHRIRRSVRVLAVLFAGAITALAVGMTAALVTSASPPPSPAGSSVTLIGIRPGNGLPGGTAASPVPAPAHPAVSGGMPGWQITLIAIGAALLVAAVALLLDQARTARRRPTATVA